LTREEARKSAEKHRQQLIDRLDDEGAYNLARKLERCGEVVPLNCTGCGRSRTGRTRCDLRWCPVCQRHLAAQTSIRYSAIAEDCDWPNVVTFTAQHSIGSWMTIRDMRRAFTKLRRLRWWKAKVKGGVAAFEMTLGKNGMHVHIHALIDCKWLSVTETAPKVGATKDEWRRKGKRSRMEVSQQWSLCCGRPADVHVRRMRGKNISDATKEVLKYAVKGSDLVSQKGQIAPIIRSMTGSRLVSSWGTFYRHPSVKRQKPAPAMCQCGCSDWMLEQTVDSIVNRIKRHR
jgi:hypothetical protein